MRREVGVGWDEQSGEGVWEEVISGEMTGVIRVQLSRSLVE